jgi:hypothetical protein
LPEIRWLTSSICSMLMLQTGHYCQSDNID